MKNYISHSSTETHSIGKTFGSRLANKTVVCFFGELAAGKTTFIKGLVEGAAQIDPQMVQSPTFTYLNIYEGTQTIYHFDLYRLENETSFFDLGFHEFVESDAISCIEWPERALQLIPASALKIRLEIRGDQGRRILYPL